MPKKPSKQEQELLHDLQRLRADFENYRKRVDADKHGVAELAKAATILKLLPVIDNIERAISHAPKDLADNAWAQGVVALGKSLDKMLAELGLTRIEASPGTPFDPDMHEAVTMEDGNGEHEVVAEGLRTGYKLGEQVIRPSMVRVTRRD